jgi:hypothetical protein
MKIDTIEKKADVTLFTVTAREKKSFHQESDYN